MLDELRGMEPAALIVLDQVPGCMLPIPSADLLPAL